MLSSTAFVVIVSRFPAVFGDLQNFEKKSFASMGGKKIGRKFQIGNFIMILMNAMTDNFYILFVFHIDIARM